MTVSAAEFRDPRKHFSLRYPSDWATGDSVVLPQGAGQGASFIGASPDGEALLEVYSLKANPLKLYAELYQDASRRKNAGTRVVGTGPFELASGQRCVRVTLTAIEPTIRASHAEFTTDYFLVDAGVRVLSLNFKTLTSRFSHWEPVFDKVVRSLDLPD